MPLNLLRFYIKSNQSIKDLWGLHNLDSLTGDFEITDNENLEALHGLESLRSVDGFKFTGDKIEESKLKITNNPKLSACSVIGICFLRNYAEFDISNNSENCNSIVEVMSGCNFISVEEKSNHKLKVYPNPSSGIINVSSENKISDIKLMMYIASNLNTYFFSSFFLFCMALHAKIVHLTIAACPSSQY